MNLIPFPGNKSDPEPDPKPDQALSSPFDSIDGVLDALSESHGHLTVGAALAELSLMPLKDFLALLRFGKQP